MGMHFISQCHFSRCAHVLFDVGMSWLMLPTIDICRLPEYHKPWLMVFYVGRRWYLSVNAYMPQTMSPCLGWCNITLYDVMFKVREDLGWMVFYLLMSTRWSMRKWPISHPSMHKHTNWCVKALVDATDNNFILQSICAYATIDVWMPLFLFDSYWPTLLCQSAHAMPNTF